MANEIVTQESTESVLPSSGHTLAVKYQDEDGSLSWGTPEGYPVDVYTRICVCCHDIFDRGYYDDPIEDGPIWMQPECPHCFEIPEGCISKRDEYDEEERLKLYREEELRLYNESIPKLARRPNWVTDLDIENAE